MSITPKYLPFMLVFLHSGSSKSSCDVISLRILGEQVFGQWIFLAFVHAECLYLILILERYFFWVQNSGLMALSFSTNFWWEIHGRPNCSPTNHRIVFSACFQESLPFNFQCLWNGVSRCGFLWIYSLWDLLGSFNLVDVFYQSWKGSSYCFLKIFFWPVLLSF